MIYSLNALHGAPFEFPILGVGSVAAPRDVITAAGEDCMSNYVNVTDREWDNAEVVGVKMERCLLWGGGHGVITAFFRMCAGTRLPLHHHSGWVQILVLEGMMRVEPRDAEARDIGPGGYYFVEPGDTHVETTVEDSLILVTVQRENPSQAPTIVP
jgi:quercetin dioxygenase-like cupin family protein